MEPLLKVRGLRTYFFTEAGTARAVDGVDLDIGKGEVVGLVGESGSGKSVTALSVLRLIPDPPGRIVSGSITYKGRDLLKMPLEDIRNIRGQEIGMVFQEPMTSLNPVFTIGMQVMEVIQAHEDCSRGEAFERAVQMLELVGIPEARLRMQDYPHHFSGGMRQRVMIALALSCEPKLIIADEPTTALDVTIQAQILELMKDLTRQLGVSLIVITHNLGVVARYADRVNVMYAGKMIEMGNAQQIYHDPHHPYTLGLLASVPRMDQPRGNRLLPIDGQPPDLTRLDQGCAFRPRCRFAIDRCTGEIPVLEDVGDAHTAACWRQSEIRELRIAS